MNYRLEIREIDYGIVYNVCKDKNHPYFMKITQTYGNVRWCGICDGMKPFPYNDKPSKESMDKLKDLLDETI
jgi:hypothetical protein